MVRNAGCRVHRLCGSWHYVTNVASNDMRRASRRRIRWDSVRWILMYFVKACACDVWNSRRRNGGMHGARGWCSVIGWSACTCVDMSWSWKLYHEFVTSWICDDIVLWRSEMDSAGRFCHEYVMTRVGRHAFISYNLEEDHVVMPVNHAVTSHINSLLTVRLT